VTREEPGLEYCTVWPVLCRGSEVNRGQIIGPRKLKTAASRLWSFFKRIFFSLLLSTAAATVLLLVQRAHAIHVIVVIIQFTGKGNAKNTSEGRAFFSSDGVEEEEEETSLCRTGGGRRSLL